MEFKVITMNNYNSNYNDDLNRDYFGQNPDIERQNGYTGNNSMNNPPERPGFSRSADIG